MTQNKLIILLSRRELKCGYPAYCQPLVGEIYHHQSSLIIRSLLYKLLTSVTNGDKVVIEKLDSGVSSSCEDVDDEDFAITVDHKCLVDEDPRFILYFSR